MKKLVFSAKFSFFLCQFVAIYPLAHALTLTVYKK
jgi:hypothetical protein